MPRLTSKSGGEMMNELSKIGFEIKSQKGSQIKLIRNLGLDRQILLIPNHKELKVGTLHSIYKKAREYLSEEEMSNIFN